jgi:ABC-type lipoprotein release transport system permease subunit
MLMSVLERLNQFGVLMSIGLKLRLLVRMIVYEGIILGIIGSALGIVLGIAISYPIVEYGLDLSSRVGDGIQIGGTVNSSILYGKYSPSLIGFYSLFALGFSVLSTIYPAYKLSQLKPIEAMRHQ